MEFQWLESSILFKCPIGIIDIINTIDIIGNGTNGSIGTMVPITVSIETNVTTGITESIEYNGSIGNIMVPMRLIIGTSYLKQID